ncbi:hypothetical protein WJ974_05085 [Achromobacter xylosoxidans]
MVAQLIPGLGVALVGGAAPPLHGQVFLARHPLALGVHPAEHGLRFGVALDGGFLAPLRGKRVVLRHAATVRIHHRQIELRAGVPLVGGAAQPCHRLRIVLLAALRIRVHQAQAVLRAGRQRPAAQGQQQERRGPSRRAARLAPPDALAAHAGGERTEEIKTTSCS